jgi:hypothetical protein
MRQGLFFVAILFVGSALAQNPQLHYEGSNHIITEAIAEANKILSNPDFCQQLEGITSFDNTTFSGKQIADQMKSMGTVDVIEYYKRHTRTNAKTATKISLNTAKLQRYSDHAKNLATITNTLIHEFVHATDWTINKRWDYTHRTQYQEQPPVSTPYIIGALAEKFAKNPQ